MSRCQSRTDRSTPECNYAQSSATVTAEGHTNNCHRKYNCDSSFMTHVYVVYILRSFGGGNEVENTTNWEGRNLVAEMGRGHGSR